MARVGGLYRLGLRVPDLKAARAFYAEQWGMALAGEDKGELWFQSRSVDHNDLQIRREDAPGLDHLALFVNSARDLELIERRARDGGVTVTPTDGGVTLHDPDGNRIELILPATHDPMRPDMAPEPEIGPKKLGHVVLWTPRVEQMEAFYAILGFQVSDRTHVGMSFLRCNADHHAIALVRSRSKTGIQHAAFDTGSTDKVMREMGRLRRGGVACIWGVGRHGPGNNVFTYYQDPAGLVVEFYGEMEKVAVDQPIAEPRYWGPEHGGDIWGVAGPPPAPFRD